MVVNCLLRRAKSNWMKAMQAQKGREAGTYVILVMSDTGTGMNAKTLKNLFERFYNQGERQERV